MSAPINDGGPAFPAPAYAANITDKGMTLRDYFAGQALAGALADPTCDLAPIELAKKIYEFADAMLAAREGKQ
jgi:hypothetical protein